VHVFVPIECFSFLNNYFFLGVGVRLSPLVTSATSWPIVPAPDDG
jgi:hypothetical protein